MAMGKRRARQESLFVSSEELPKSQGHPFYKRLNQLLAEAGFDRWIENHCQQYYEQEETRGQPSIPPGVYFRMLFVGYFENIGSQRGIAWRCGDSLSLREFLGIPMGKCSPDHSTMTNTRKRLPPEVFDEVFQFVLSIAAEKKLIGGKTVGVDSTLLEADAAMKSIVRRDTGEDWKKYVVSRRSKCARSQRMKTSHFEPGIWPMGLLAAMPRKEAQRGESTQNDHRAVDTFVGCAWLVAAAYRGGAGSRPPNRRAVRPAAASRGAKMYQRADRPGPALGGFKMYQRADRVRVAGRTRTTDLRVARLGDRRTG